MAKEYFSHDTDSISDIKIVKMMSDYGYLGFGYYWAILAEIYRNGGRYEFEDLGILAKNLGIELKKLKSYINQGITKYTHKGVGLFCQDDNGFWSNSLLTRMQLRQKKSKAGKTQTDEINRIELEGIERVNLTQEEYDKLLEKYGKEYLTLMINELENWLWLPGVNQKKYLGKNHYGHFRKNQWVDKKVQKILDAEQPQNNSVLERLGRK